MTHGLQISMHGLSDVGQKRLHNEDAIAWDAGAGLALLADGMGGHQAGEVASQLALEVLQKALAGVQAKGKDPADYRRAVLEAVHQANRAIYSQSLQRADYAGMGTTLVLLLFVERRVICVHVGDSRAYRLREGELRRLTSDHSLVQQMIDTGQCSEQEALLSVSRNIITRALGIADDVAVDSAEYEVQEGDVYLLCSDGLTDLVADNEICDSLMHNRDDLPWAAQALVAQANARGAKDNISVILAAVRGAGSP